MSVRARRKGLIFSQSPQDYNISKVMYYSYSPQMKIKIAVMTNTLVMKDQLLATIIIQGQQSKLLFPYSGIVKQLGTIPQIMQNSTVNITILTLERCQHWPSPVPSEKGTDLCMHCGEVVWHYYEKGTVDFTFGDIEKQMELSLFDDLGQQNNHSNFEWLVTKNQHITKNTQIAKAFDQQLKLDIIGKIRYMADIDNLYSSKRQGNQNHFDKILISISKVICRHQKVIDQTCQFCLQTLQEAPLLYLFQQTQNTHSISGRALEIEQQEYINKLIQNRKAILILDLDNTILNAISEIFIKQDLNKDPGQIEELIALPAEYPAKLEGLETMEVTRVLVKMRPYFQYFLKAIVELYDIFVYTKGTRSYAQSVCDAIRQQYPTILQGTSHFKRHKMITRDEDPNLQKKSIKYIVPSRFESIVILDDRRQIWQSAYCIYVKQYFYFKMDYEKKQWYIDQRVKKDTYLIYVTQTLKKIHSVYFQKLLQKESKKMEQKAKGPIILSKIHHNLKKCYCMVSKLNLYYKDVHSNFWIHMGCTEELKELVYATRLRNPQQVTFFLSKVIRSMKIDSTRAKQIKYYSQDLKVPIVSELWIMLCYEYNYAFPQTLFLIDDCLQEYIDPKCVVYDELVSQTAIKLL